MYIYADNAATTKISENAMKAMCDGMNNFYGNPSSLHTVGQVAAEQLEKARTSIAAVFHAKPTEIYFTSGGSEADNQAILSAAQWGEKHNKFHIISDKIEHHAVLHTLKKLEQRGFEITLLDVDEQGFVSPEDVKSAIKENTALVTVMYANNEIGTIEPIEEIAKICHERGVFFHTDAVQAVGHIKIDVDAMGMDALSLSAHKFHGPKGIGLLYAKKGFPLFSFIEGGAQERGKRAGTQNLPAIMGMELALLDSQDNLEERMEQTRVLRDRLIAGLSKIPHSMLNGPAEKRLPGNVHFCFEGIEGESLLLLLDARGIAASSGSACTSGSLDPSHVLLAIGRPHEIAHGSLRLTITEENTEEEIDKIIEDVTQVVKYLRDMSPVWEKIK